MSMLKYSCDSTIGTAISDVLQPLMHTQHLDEGLERRLRRRHHFGAMGGLPARGVTVGRHDDRAARRVEHLEIVPAVAGIVEAAIAIGGNERGTLPARRHVVRTVGRQHAIENAEMRGDRLGEFARRAGRQHDLAAFAMLLAQPLEQDLAIGQRGWIDVDAVGDRLLQPCRAAGQPERHQENIERILLEKDEQTFPQKVRCNQRAVEIDRKRDRVPVRPRIHFFLPCLKRMTPNAGSDGVMCRYTRAMFRRLRIGYSGRGRNDR